jgi:hypothetical protein
LSTELIKNSLKQERALKVLLKHINIYWIGFSIYTISFIFLSIMLQPNFKLLNALQAVGLLLFLYGASRIIDFRLENNYLKKIYVIFLLWTIITIVRGVSLNYEFLKKTLLDPYGGVFLYLAPLILLFPLKLQNIQHSFRVILLFGLVSLGCFIIYYKRLFDIGTEDAKNLIEYLAKTLSIPCGFILLTYIYHEKKHVIFSFVIVMLVLFFAIIQARRGLVFTGVSILFFFFIMLVYNNKKNINTFILVICSIPFLIFSLGSYMGIENKLFDYLKDRKGEDTRSELELYYYADMTRIDWAVGRGMSGLIAAPFSDALDNERDLTPGYRTGIETDYLNIILKGGMIGLGLIMMISLPAIILGFFHSKNTLSKAAALWITLWVLDLYPTTVTTFTLNYLLDWMSIGICYSKEIRLISEKELKQLLSPSIKML